MPVPPDAIGPVAVQEAVVDVGVHVNPGPVTALMMPVEIDRFTVGVTGSGPALLTVTVYATGVLAIAAAGPLMLIFRSDAGLTVVVVVAVSFEEFGSDGVVLETLSVFVIVPAAVGFSTMLIG